MFDSKMIQDRIDLLKKEYLVVLAKPITKENQVTAKNVICELKALNHMTNIEPIATYQERTHSEKVVSEEKGFCHHNHCDTDLDAEMDRIIKYGATEHMRMLSDVLSEHFEDLMQMNPKMYNMLLGKLKGIKA